MAEEFGGISRCKDRIQNFIIQSKMRNAGIEPATCGFGIRRSTTELIPHE